MVEYTYKKFVKQEQGEKGELIRSFLSEVYKTWKIKENSEVIIQGKDCGGIEEAWDTDRRKGIFFELGIGRLEYNPSENVLMHTDKGVVEDVKITIY